MDVVDPGLARALERFERMLTDRFPGHLAQMRPGADDSTIDDLRAAVAPYLLPVQVEQLYRWRAGGFVHLFGGFYLREPQDLARCRAFIVDELHLPATWLPLLDRHSHTIVAMDVPGWTTTDTRVWSGDTHDGSTRLLFGSLEALVDTLCDVADIRRLDAVRSGAFPGTLGLREGLDVFAVDEPAFLTYRRRRTPDSWTYGDAVEGTIHSCVGPLPTWPAAWLHAYGVPEASVRPHGGATHTIAQALAAAASGPVTATLAVRVGTHPRRAALGLREVEDATGTLALVGEEDARGVKLPDSGDVELDVLVVPGHLPPPVPPPPADASPLLVEHHEERLRRLAGHTVGKLVAIRADEGEHHQSLRS